MVARSIILVWKTNYVKYAMFKICSGRRAVWPTRKKNRKREGNDRFINE